MISQYHTTDFKCATASTSFFLFSLSCASFSSTIRSYWFYKKFKKRKLLRVQNVFQMDSITVWEQLAHLMLFHQRHHICYLVLTLELCLFLVLDGFCFGQSEPLYLLSRWFCAYFFLPKELSGTISKWYQWPRCWALLPLLTWIWDL